MKTFILWLLSFFSERGAMNYRAYLIARKIARFIRADENERREMFRDSARRIAENQSKSE